MPSNRMGRINEAMQRRLSALLRRLKDPRITQGGVVSVTRVDTAADLRQAKVYVSVLDKGREKEVLQGLRSAAAFLRREAAGGLGLRYAPQLLFIPDDSIAYGAHILEILQDPERVKPPRPDEEGVLPEEEEG